MSTLGDERKRLALARAVEGPEPAAREMSLAEVLQGSSKGSWRKGVVTLFVTIFLFVSLGFIRWSAKEVVMLIAVLLVHELGHLLAMKKFKYKNVRMFFIPLFGAAVAGQPSRASGAKRAVVSLAGPLPGIVIGTCFAILHSWTGVDFYRDTAVMFIAINVFNLLPFPPLDGGRFMFNVLFSRSLVLEIAFRAIAVLGLLVLAYRFRDTFLGLLGFFALLAIRSSYLEGKAAKALAPEFQEDPPAELEKLDPQSLEKIADKAKEAFGGAGKVQETADRVRNIWERLHCTPPRLWTTLGFLAVYLLAFVGPFFVYIIATVIGGASDHVVEYARPDGAKALRWVRIIAGDTTKSYNLDKNGYYHGRSCDFDSKGRVSDEGHWYHGKWHGAWATFNSKGATTSVTIFDKGRFVSRRKRRFAGWIDLQYEDLPATLQDSYAAHDTAKPMGISLERFGRSRRGRQSTADSADENQPLERVEYSPSRGFFKSE